MSKTPQSRSLKRDVTEILLRNSISLSRIGISVGTGMIESAMRIDELKSKVSIYRALLKGKDGTLCKFSEEGPVGISVIDDLVGALESQEKRIEDLEKKFRAVSKSQAPRRK